jgi:glutamine amidotransferase
MSIVIVNYGMGNLRSIQKKFDWDGKKAIISDELCNIEKADKLILPGVGHFSVAVQKLKSMNLWELLNYKVLEEKTPVLGICLGMQLMAKKSEEGDEKGFGWFDADVIRFQVQDKLRYKVPHIGWNDVAIKKESPLMKNMDEIQKFYFVHSYHMVSYNPSDILTETEYEYSFVSSVSKDNIFGVQFHPEKSHEQGRELLNNFYLL